MKGMIESTIICLDASKFISDSIIVWIALNACTLELSFSSLSSKVFSITVLSSAESIN